MPVTWPENLPDYMLRDGFEERPPDVQVRTEMEEGPAKVRRWGIADVRIIQGSMEMDADQLDAFDSFYNSTLQGGVLRFEFKHPRTGEVKELRFMKDSVHYENVGGNVWRVFMGLEVMP